MSNGIRFKVQGSFKNTEKFLNSASDLPKTVSSIFHKYGQMGVTALQSATPKRTGETAASWSYQVTDTGIVWSNSKLISSGTPLVILIQYGHGTRQGGYVRGRDFINPAIRPIFDQIVDECWKEIQNL